MRQLLVGAPLRPAPARLRVVTSSYANVNRALELVRLDSYLTTYSRRDHAVVITPLG